LLRDPRGSSGKSGRKGGEEEDSRGPTRQFAMLKNELKQTYAQLMSCQLLGDKVTSASVKQEFDGIFEEMLTIQMTLARLQ
jgi:hypothetical protein